VYRTDAVLDGSQLSKQHLDIWAFGLFSFPFLAPPIDNADPLLVINTRGPFHEATNFYPKFVVKQSYKVF